MKKLSLVAMLLIAVGCAHKPPLTTQADATANARWIEKELNKVALNRDGLIRFRRFIERSCEDPTDCTYDKVMVLKRVDQIGLLLGVKPPKRDDNGDPI